MVLQPVPSTFDSLASIPMEPLNGPTEGSRRGNVCRGVTVCMA